jgi:hypothetical protein
MTEQEILTDQWGFYKQYYLPTEVDLTKQALSGIPVDYQQQQAKSDIDKSFQQNRGIAERSLERAGVADASMPDSTNRQSDMIRAAAEAGARNTIRRAAPEDNLARLDAVAKLGQGIPVQAFSSKNYAGSILSGGKLRKAVMQDSIVNASLGAATNGLEMYQSNKSKTQQNSVNSRFDPEYGNSNYNNGYGTYSKGWGSQSKTSQQLVY